MKGLAFRALALLVFIGTVSAGSIPHLLNIQGYVTNSGSPYTGDLTLTVATASGAETYNSGALTVSASSGRFNKIVGPLTPTAGTYSINLSAVVSGTTLSISNLAVSSTSGRVVADELSSFMGKQLFWDPTSANKLCYYDPPNATESATCSAGTRYFNLKMNCEELDEPDSGYGGNGDGLVSDTEAANYCKEKVKCPGSPDVYYDGGTNTAPTGSIYCLKSTDRSGKVFWDGGITCSLSTDTAYKVPVAQNKYCATLTTPGNINADLLGGQLPSFYESKTSVWDSDSDIYIDPTYIGVVSGVSDCDDMDPWAYPYSRWYTTNANGNTLAGSSSSMSCGTPDAFMPYRRAMFYADYRQLKSFGGVSKYLYDSSAVGYSYPSFREGSQTAACKNASSQNCGYQYSGIIYLYDQPNCGGSTSATSATYENACN